MTWENKGGGDIGERGRGRHRRERGGGEIREKEGGG